MKNAVLKSIGMTVVFTVVLNIIGSALGVKTLGGAIIISVGFSMLLNWRQLSALISRRLL